MHMHQGRNDAERLLGSHLLVFTDEQLWALELRVHIDGGGFFMPPKHAMLIASSQ